MHNFPLQITQNPALSAVTGAAGKSDANPNKPGNAEPVTAFKDVLANQAKAESNPPQQAAQPAQKNAEDETEPKPDVKEQNDAQPKQPAKAKAAAHAQRGQQGQAKGQTQPVDKKPDDDSQALELGELAEAPSTHDGKLTKADKKIVDEPEKAEADTELGANTATVLLTTQTAETRDKSPVKDSATVPADVADNQPDISDKPGLQKRDLETKPSDPGLGNPSAFAVGQDHADLSRKKEAGAEHSDWVNYILENVAKQKHGAEVSAAKSANDFAKQLDSKAPAAPVAYQPAAQVSQLPVAAQIASANSITAYPGKAGWDQAIGQKVIWMVGAAEQSATLTLNPPDLGPLQIVIHVHNDQADTTFISEHPEVRKALENGLTTLRDMMGSAGINLGQTNISSGGQPQQNFQQAERNGYASASASRESFFQAESLSAPDTGARVASGMVDTFA